MSRDESGLAAAARAILRQKRTRQRFGPGYTSFPHPDLNECAERLAEAYGVDADEPLSKEALVALGGVLGEYGDGVLFGSWQYGLFFAIPEDEVLMCRLEQGNDSVVIPTPKTVGHARRLLAALSILAEQQ